MLNDCSIRYVRSSLRCLLSLSCCMSRPSTFLSIKAFNMTLNLLNVSFKEVRVKLLNSHYKKKQLRWGLGFSYDKIRTYKNNCILFRKSMLMDEIVQFVGRMDGCLTQKVRNRSHVRFCVLFIETMTSEAIFDEADSHGNEMAQRRSII